MPVSCSLLTSAALVGSTFCDHAVRLVFLSLARLRHVLTTSTLRLVIFTTSHSIMSLPKDPSAPAPPPLVKTPSSERKTLKSTFQKLGHQLNPFRRRTGPANYVSFANGMLVIYVAWGTFFHCQLSLATLLTTSCERSDLGCHFSVQHLRPLRFRQRRFVTRCLRPVIYFSIVVPNCCIVY